jgi:hypothetical protein
MMHLSAPSTEHVYGRCEGSLCYFVRMREDSPFAPGFGVAPPFVAGRAELTHNTLARLRRGPSHEFHTIVLGARGTGKTIWIDSIADHVRTEMQSPVIEWNASDRDQPLRTAINEQAADVEHELASRMRRGLKRLEGGMTLKAAPIGVGAEATAKVTRTASSSEEGSVVHTLTRLGRIAATRQRIVLVCVDELQAGSHQDLTTLGSAIQTVASRKRLPVALLAAGLPSTQQVLHDMAVGQDRSPSAGFLERQDIMMIGNLDDDGTYDAFERPIQDGDWTIDPDALDAMVQRSNGYPFAVQLIGHETWNAAASPGHITITDVEAGVARAGTRMQQTVFIPRWRKMSPADRHYLTHAARLRDLNGMASTTAISTAMYGTATSAGKTRERLIDTHHVLEPGQRGTVQFTIPGMAQWILNQPDNTDADVDQHDTHDFGADNSLGRDR